MAKHVLQLDIINTNNLNVFKLTDSSIYADGLDIKCPTLHITVPGFTTPVAIDVTPGFNLTLTACDLGLSVANCTLNIPDGVYNIRYSVSPNDQVWVEYDFLRTSDLLQRWKNQICNLDFGLCNPDADTRKTLAELRLIKDMIDAAKVKVEDCHSTKEGVDLFHFANKRLSNYQSCC